MFRRCLLLAGGLLAALLVLLLPLLPCLLAFLDRDFEKLPELLRDYQANMRKQHQLDRKNEVLLWRVSNQKQLIGELLAGRVTFLQVAAGFQYLAENPPDEKAFPLPFPGATPEERTCRQVISWVEAWMANHPESRDEVLLERLRQELAEMLTRPEGIQLPPPGSGNAGLSSPAWPHLISATPSLQLSGGADEITTSPSTIMLSELH